MTAEVVFRRSYGKLLAHLLSRGFDIMVAEDALSSAFQVAIVRWETGIPENPEAWLHAVAYRRAIDQKRRVARSRPLDWARDLPTEETVPEIQTIEDERLRLFFLCTHPAIDVQIQTPLMLQLLLGFSAANIAEVYVRNESQIAQRLVRAKRKIRDANILPSLPPADQLANRSGAVLDAIYALYCRGWECPTDSTRISAALEALELAEIMAKLAPDLPESLGLLALILFCESRRPARMGGSASFVALEDQDISQWDAKLIRRAEATLSEASKKGRPGRFQLEAAIQSAHVGRLTLGIPGWSTLLKLYDGLIAVAPSVGNQIGRIAVLAQVHGPEKALTELNELDCLEPYQPFFALQCHLSRELGDQESARNAAQQARDLSHDPAIRTYFADIIQAI